MFQQIRRVFFRIRIYLSALRTGIFGVALVCATWVFAAPPSQLETDRLSLSSADTAQHEGLRTHRMAKLLMVVGTDRFYQMVADQSGTGISALEVRLNIIAAAEGVPVAQYNANATPEVSTEIATDTQLSNANTALDIDQIQKNSVRAGGAKFMSARTD